MSRITFPRYVSTALAIGTVGLAVALAGCDSSSSSGNSNNTGQFGGLPVSGLTYETESESGTTDAQGRFDYRDGESVTFSIGTLELGTAPADDAMSALDLVDDDDAVGNLAALLQSLDQDGDLNNGIQISEAASRIASEQIDFIEFAQPAAEFAGSISDLFQALNAAGESVFSDTDPRPRGLLAADDAAETLARALSERRTVTTRYGELRGFSTLDDIAWSWYGIPYAAPPVGDLRWKPPVAPTSWEGVRDAVAWADQSAQDPALEMFGEGGMSEDSLHLNVTVPKGYDGEQLPVMVWFHGGGFSMLTGNTRGFNNTSLPNQGVIVVTVNHRLGPFGYFAHPELTAESEHDASGNYGQLDLVAALEWVQDNIAAFGGNPDNVTIFGESGGGGKVLSLMHSPLAEGLFHRAIVQSGMADEADERIPVDNPLATQEALGENLVAELGLENESDVLAALRTEPWTDIQAAAAALEPEMGEPVAGGFVARPTIDGWYKTMGIQDAYDQGEFHDVPFMAGANTGDTPQLIDGFIWYMPWMADAAESNQYAYVFDHVPAGWRAADVPAYHGIELVYVFDYTGSFLSHYLLGLTGHEDPDPFKFMTTDEPGVDLAEYEQVTGDTMAMWAAFARTGNPSLPERDWPAYTSDEEAYMKISLTPGVGHGLEDAFPER